MAKQKGVHRKKANAKKVSTAQIQERRMRVAMLLLARNTYRQIARQLKVSLGTVASDVEAMMQEWRSDSVAAIGEAKELDLQHIAMIIRAQLPGVMRGEIPASEMTLKALTRRAKMLGYDAPEQLQVFDDKLTEIEQMTQEEVDAEINKLMAERLQEQNAARNHRAKATRQQAGKTAGARKKTARKK